MKRKIWLIGVIIIIACGTGEPVNAESISSEPVSIVKEEIGTAISVYTYDMHGVSVKSYESRLTETELVTLYSNFCFALTPAMQRTYINKEWSIEIYHSENLWNEVGASINAIAICDPTHKCIVLKCPRRYTVPQNTVTFTHEAGHFVDWVYNGNNSTFENYKEFSKSDLTQIAKMRGTDYCQTNKTEAFAEAYACYKMYPRITSDTMPDVAKLMSKIELKALSKDIIKTSAA